ncbi:hypothetical protein KOR34_42750 [Posidoniimonas corsicana]|uniref:Uncharacterized protein n=1 Tax=Posidoniimonas corsicana TaxID=1938618 RepID=A0A5C5V435_9BACT|nr:hypothetical protein [Posidoniimonas corsicana]TWT32512.1 hypothetical protein KOR34_42750 [Posidoniimonas corsicana]
MGDTERAKHHLAESGKTKGSPNLGSFGPNMSLALGLLERGESDAVLAYFDQCRNFWKSGGDELDRWSEQVRRGQTPGFGANLVY